MKLWIYDLRTNKHFTLKENPLFARSHFVCVDANAWRRRSHCLAALG